MEEVIMQTIPQGYVPSYFIYIISFAIFIGFISITKAYKGKKSWGDFPYVVLFTGIISALVIAWMVVMPETIVNIIGKIGGIWNW